jgi:hypothetical protein
VRRIWLDRQVKFMAFDLEEPFRTRVTLAEAEMYKGQNSDRGSRKSSKSVTEKERALNAPLKSTIIPPSWNSQAHVGNRFS